MPLFVPKCRHKSYLVDSVFGIWYSYLIVEVRQVLLLRTLRENEVPAEIGKGVVKK